MFDTSHTPFAGARWVAGGPTMGGGSIGSACYCGIPGAFCPRHRIHDFRTRAYKTTEQVPIEALIGADRELARVKAELEREKKDRLGAIAHAAEWRQVAIREKTRRENQAKATASFRAAFHDLTKRSARAITRANAEIKRRTHHPDYGPGDIAEDGKW